MASEVCATENTHTPSSQSTGGHDRRNPHVSRACINCRNRKAKCSASRPCHACTSINVECLDSQVPDQRMKREAAAASDGDNAMGLGEGHSSSFEPCIDPGSTETRVTSLEATVAGLTNAVLALQATVATLEMQARSTNQALQFLLRDATLLPSHPFSSGILAQQPSNFNGSFTTSQRLSLGYQHGSPNSTLAPVSPAVSHAIGAAPAPFATPATQYAPFSFPATGGVDHGGWIARGEASGTTQDNLYPGLFAAPRHPASRPPSNTTTAHVFSSSSASYPVPIASSMPGSAPGDQEVHGARGESSSRDVDRFWSLHTHDC